MKQGKRGKGALLLPLILSLLLTLTGGIMIYRVFDRYEETVIQNEDHHLMGLARSVDRSITSYLSRYSATLTDLTDRWSFRTAETAWLEDGDRADLLARMTEPLVARDPLVAAFLALDGETVALSTNGRTDYTFPPLAGREGEVSIRPCVDGSGVIYLAFHLEQEGRPSYALLLNLVQFYERVAGSLSAGTQDHIMLLDAGGQTLLHKASDRVLVELTGQLTGTGCDYAGLPLLLESQGTGEQGGFFYDTHSCQDAIPYTARMATLPADGESNGFFAIGVSMNYDQVIRPLRTGGVRLLAYGGMVVTGILLLVLLALRTGWKNDRIHRELLLLREKKAAAEALTRQTQALAHHQRLETIGTLTSSIAHEFNNLLTPIMGYSLMALEKLPPEEEELYDDLLEIYNASLEAKTIISRLSDLSRKNTPLTLQYVSPDALAEKVLNVAAPAKPRSVLVDIRLDCRHLWVLGNETQLSQLLLNLVLNAFQAMEPAGGTLTLSTACQGEEVILQVADTGPGIPPEILPHIFEPFFTTKGSGRGTGLGLPIVRQMAEEHGGQVLVDSQPGAGTTVTVHLPLSPRETPEGPALTPEA